MVRSFPDLTTKGKATKAKINKRDYIKLKVSAEQRKPSPKRKKKRQPVTEWEKIFANLMSAIGSTSKKIKNLQLNTKKTKQCNFKKDLNNYLVGDIQMGNRYMKSVPQWRE